jgi:hypothetical protein
MRKTIYLLNIGYQGEGTGYAPQITALTYPLIYRYAEKIGARIHVITKRKFPTWDLDYEKLQIHDLAKERDDAWSLYIDSDAVVHPELPDVTALVSRDTVAHNGVDFAALRWRLDGYFYRDGRNIGSCNWLALASDWCRDLWRPLDDLTPAQAVANIFPTVHEQASGVITAAHLVSDYALSRNIARFGLKCTTLNELWPKLGFTNAEFFFHLYTDPIAVKLARIEQTLDRWNIQPAAWRGYHADYPVTV